MTVDAEAIYKKLKDNPNGFNEELHCPMVIRIMCNKDKGTISAFCAEALISNRTFFKWVAKSQIFEECYLLAKMFSQENWEEEGRQLRNRILEKGESDHSFEYWRMVGWSRFGIGKNSRIRLDLNPEDSPNMHYSQLLKQAASGDFTAGEIKQLMEAINVGLNAHQVFALQKEIDELKSNVEKINTNKDAHNTFTNKGIAQKD
jgi:hypothetical protein